MQALFARSDPELNRGTEKQCQVCSKRFSIMVRQHQCKRCLKAVCSDCGSFRRQVYSPNFVKGPHRVCKSCKDGSEYICEYIKNNNLKFGEMSAIGERWVKKITKKPVTYGEDTSQHKLLTREVFSQIWNSYSFQLREFVGVLTFQYEQDGVYNMVYNVYTTVISAASGQTLTQVIYLIIFILCFCSSDKAVLLLLFLIDLKQSQKEVRSLAFNYLKVMPFNNQLTKIENYVHYRLDRFIDSFLVNCITIEASISLISKTMDRKNLEELLMLFSSHIFTNREMLAAKAVENTRMMVDCMMLRNCLLEQINANYKYIKMKNISLLVPQNRLSVPINSSPTGNQSLKRMETMGLLGSQRQNFRDMSPKSSLQGGQQQSNSQQFRIKPNFVKRAQSENIYANNDDSFSFVNDGQSRLPFKASPDRQPTNNILDSIQESPPARISQNQQKDSPFRKAMNEEFSLNQLPQLFDLIKPVRKNTEYSETTQRISIKNCEKCQYYIEQSQKSAKLLNDRQNQWLKNQDQYEKFIEEKDRKYEENRMEKDKLNIILNDYEKKLAETQYNYQQLYQKHNYLLKEQNSFQQKLNNMQRQNIQSRRSKDKLAEELSFSISQIKRLNSNLQNEKKELKEAQLMVIALQKVADQNSALKDQINRQMSQNNQQKSKLQSKIASLQKKNEEIQLILNQSMSSLSNQSSFYLKKTAEQEITITSLNLTLKKAQEQATSLKDKLTQSLKETIRSSETMKSLRTAYLESQNIRQAQTKEIESKGIQIISLQKQVEELKTSLAQSQAEKIDLTTTNQQSITQIKIKTKQYMQIQSKLNKQEKTNTQLFAKLTQISNLMMQIEQQKMELAEENFSLHEILKKHRIKWE